MYLTIVAMVWGLWLLAPWATFTASPTFAALSALVPEELLGAVLAGLGCLRGVALLLPGEHRTFRAACALLCSAAWMFVAGALIYSSPASTAAVTYPLYAVTSAWVYVRLLWRVP